MWKGKERPHIENIFKFLIMIQIMCVSHCDFIKAWLRFKWDWKKHKGHTSIVLIFFFFTILANTYYNILKNASINLVRNILEKNENNL